MITLINYIFWLLIKAVDIYILAVVVYALMSWFPGAYETKFGQFLAKIVEPFQSLFNFATFGMISFAPIVAIIVLTFVQKGLMFLGQLILGGLY